MQMSQNQEEKMPNVRMQNETYSYVDEWRRLWEPDLEAIGSRSGQTTDPTRVDPKVLQWVKDHCARMPHFVKIINPNAAHGRPGLLSNNSNSLGVPGLFVKEHFQELDRVITLEQSDGRKWKVAFSAPQNYPIWNQGWKRFARDQNLICGDVVVFVLVRKSCFRFAVFDADGNIREKSTSTQIKDSAVVCKREFASSSSPEQPFLSNSDREQFSKRKKRIFSDHARTESLPDGTAADTLPANEDLEVPLAKEKTAFPTLQERKQETFQEEFGEANISEKSMLTLNNDAPALCNKEFLSSSSQDQPSVTEQPQKTKKRPLTDHLSGETLSKYKERDSTAGDSLPRRGHLESIPAKEQLAHPARETSNVQKELGAPSQGLNLTTKNGIAIAESPRSTTIAIPPKRAPGSGNLRQFSAAQKYPQFESLDPLAFTFKSRRRTVAPLERQRARELAMAYAGNILGHYFMTVMSETHVYRDFHMVLPKSFGAALLLPASPTRLKFLDGAGYSWEMFSKKNTMNVLVLHRKYWAIFALHHLLEEGDVCIFELKEELNLRTVFVHIFRVLPLAMAGVSSIHAHYETHEKDTSAQGI